MALFFNQRQPRKFNHTPIFFDPRKEALEERIKKKKQEMGMLEEGEYVNQIRGSFVNASSHVRRRRENPHKGSSSTNVKIGVTLVVLIILFYWFYFR